MKKTLCLLLPAIACAFLAGCKKEAVRPDAPPPTVYVTPAIEREISRSGGRVIGEVAARDKVKLEARVRGYLIEQNFSDGALVKKGAVLFRIEPEEYQANLATAEADLLKAQAQLTKTTLDYERQKELSDKNAVSKRDYDNAVAAKMDAEAAVLSAEASIKLAKLNLSYTTITAPFDGMMGYGTYSIGSLVGPESQPLATIVSLNPIFVDFNVSELSFLELLSIKPENLPDLVVRVTFQNNVEYPLGGELAALNNEMNSSTATIKLRAIFPNPESLLRPGMYVRVNVQTKIGIPAVLIPRVALASDMEGDYVYVVNAEDKVERRNVKLGATEGVYNIVLSGIVPGERIITSGVQKSRIGSKVNPEPSPNFSDAPAAPRTEDVAP